jgi:hypothetical protein
MTTKFRPHAIGRSILLAGASLAGASTNVGSTGSIQAAIDACPATGCEIILTDPDYALPRELWIDGKSSLILRRSDAMAQQGSRPRLHLASGVTPFDQAGTPENPTDPLRPAGWKRWPISSKDTAGGALDSVDPYSTTGYQYNGLVVVRRSRDVLLQGLELDGGAPAYFDNPNVWNSMYDVIFGNAGVNLHQALRTHLADCDIHGFFAAIYINDRNTSGFFRDTGSAAFSSFDSLGSGNAGDHLVERNRLHDSWWGVYDENEWDLGSDFRFNTAWHLGRFQNGFSGTGSAQMSNQTGGWFFLHDAAGPVHRIHNNTCAGIQILFGFDYFLADMQHLVYNNYWIQDRRNWSGLVLADDHQFIQHSARWFWDNTFEIGASDSSYLFDTVSSASVSDTSRCVAAGLKAPCSLVLDSALNVRTWRYDLNGWYPETGANLTGFAGGNPIQFFQSDAVEQFPGGGRFSELPLLYDGGVEFDATSRNDLWVVQAALASRDSTSSQFLVPLWDSGSSATALKGAGWVSSGWQPANAIGNPDVGAVQSQGLPPRILRLFSQKPIACSGTRVSVPLVLQDTGFWSDLRLVSVDAWLEGIPTSTSLHSYFAKLPIQLQTDSSGLVNGQNLIFAVDTTIPSPAVLRVQVTISAWSDSLGGRRTSEMAYFRSWVGQGGMSSIRSPVPGSKPFQVRRMGGVLRADLPVAGAARVEILRPDGTQIFRREFKVSGSSLDVPVTGLPHGTWVVRVAVGGMELQRLVPGF